MFTYVCLLLCVYSLLLCMSVCVWMRLKGGRDMKMDGVCVYVHLLFFLCVCWFIWRCRSNLSTVTLIRAECEGVTWLRDVYGPYRSGPIAVYRSGNARVNTGFVQTAQVLSGWRLKTGWDEEGGGEHKRGAEKEEVKRRAKVRRRRTGIWIKDRRHTESRLSLFNNLCFTKPNIFITSSDVFSFTA